MSGSWRGRERRRERGKEVGRERKRERRGGKGKGGEGRGEERIGEEERRQAVFASTSEVTQYHCSHIPFEYSNSLKVLIFKEARLISTF
jgi:hypothetical protein